MAAYDGSERTPSSLSSGGTQETCSCVQHSTQPMQGTLFRDADGHWVFKDISIPPAVKEYNRCMGGVDFSDALINYYQVIHKTQRWYKTFYHHFLDSAFPLYKSITKEHHLSLLLLFIPVILLSVPRYYLRRYHITGL